MTIRILIAEDVDLLVEAFEALLHTEPSFEVIGSVSRGDLLVDAVRRLRPDIAVVDVDMPGASGIEATAQLRADGLDCKVLLLTALPGSGHVHRALAAGAGGYLLKSTTAARLIEGIKAVVAGHTVIDPEVAAEALRTGPQPLTERQMEILRLLDQGLSTEAVADQLFLSIGTVRNYLSSAMTRLNASSRIQAINIAKERGWF